MHAAEAVEKELCGSVGVALLKALAGRAVGTPSKQAAGQAASKVKHQAPSS